MIPLSAIPWRLVGVGVVVLALGGLLWHDHYQTAKANRLVRETNQLRADITAERSAHAHELKINAKATTHHEDELKRLAKSAADTPVRSVRLCNSPTGWVPAPSPAASGVSQEGDAGHAGTPGLHSGYGSGLQTGEVDRFSDAGPELGPQLYALTDEKDLQLAQCAALIKWVGSR